MFLRAIFWILLFILAYRAVKYILRLMSGSEGENEPKAKETFNSQNSKFNIDKKDIIEADFEEIKDDEKDKSK